MPRVKPACVRRVSIGESSGSCSEEDIPLAVSDESTEGSETHMCPRCHEQFQKLHEFLHHKRICDAKALQMGEERMHSDPEDMVVSGDEEMYDPAGKRLEEVRRHRQDAENNNSLDENQSDTTEPNLGALPFPFPAASHVTLEALQNTKVAVAQMAQFAAAAMANNTDNEEALQEIQSTLFSRQHRLVFELQLLQQLQNQLSLSRQKESTASISPVPIPAPKHSPVEPPISVENSNDMKCETRESPSIQKENFVHPQTQNIPAFPSPTQIKSEAFTTPKPHSSSPPAMTHPLYSSISSSLASSIITNNDPPPSLNEPNSLEMLQRRAQEVLDSASQGLLANNLADEIAFRKSGKMSPYDGKTSGKNEPFFKHRCRYCGKVFGSDSALQIHIRSHTGERPFKCNVCGSRFTTKGNLKVHFQRHTSKFPHVKMNPNPIPEHLDKYHPPLLAQLSPGPMGPVMPPHALQFPGAGHPNFPALALYRSSHHDLLPPRSLLEKQSHSHSTFPSLRDEQEAPADLSKSSSESPIALNSDNRFKTEPQEEENIRDNSIEEPQPALKHEPSDCEPADGDSERFAASEPYDDCSTDSKFSGEDRVGSVSPNVKQDPDQPENLSSPVSQQSYLRLPQQSPLPLAPAPPPPTFNPGSISSPPSPFASLGYAFGSSVRGNTTCNICFKTFACHSALEIHYRSHTKERPFKCNVCDRGFSTKSSGDGMEVCQCRTQPPPQPNATALHFWNAIALNNIVSSGNMKQHMLTHKIRESSSQFGASDESRDSPSPASTTAQSSVSSGPTPEARTELKRSTPVDESPLPHKRPSGVSAPTNTSPLSVASSKHLCTVCRKNFSSSSALQIHMRTHTGDKPFRCAVCQKAFTTKGNLKVHMGTHMWSSGASRRGRRMSLELPPRPPPLHDTHELLRRPDLFYPYLPAPFLNGMQQKLNEMSMAQQNGLLSPGCKLPPRLLGFGPFPPVSMASSVMEEAARRTSPWERNDDRTSAPLSGTAPSPPPHAPARTEPLTV